MQNREKVLPKEVKSMLRRKMLAAALATGLAGTLVLGGCQGSGSKGKTADGKDSVRFMVGGSAAELEQYKKAVDAFNEQSEDVEVTFVGVPGDNYNEKIMTQLKSKEAPDCFYSEEASYGELNKSDMLLDISKYLDESDSNLKREDVPENLLENYTFEDKVTGVPVDCNPMVIYYNADLFKELNIKSPQEYVDEGKWNFEALQQVSEQLRDASKVGFVYENWWGPLYSFLFSAEDPVYSDDMTKAEFGSERAKAGLTYLDSNIKSKAFTFAGSLTSGESPDTLFVSGQSGMLYAGRWYVADFTDLSFAYDVAPFPYYEEPSQAVCAMPATPMVINKKASNPDAVWEFVSFYCGEQGQKIRMEGQGNAVPTVDGLDEIVLTGTPEHAQTFLDAVDIALVYPKAEALHPGMTDSITGEVEKLLVGEQDVEQTLTNIVQTVDDELQK